MDESAAEQINIRGASNAMDAATDAFLADCMTGRAAGSPDISADGDMETAQDDASNNRDQLHCGNGETEAAEDDDMNGGRLRSSLEKRKTSRAERLAHAREVKAQKARSAKKGPKAGKANKRVLKYWTKEEEASLLIALEDLGTRWSEIVRQYGEGGSVNESLKGRDGMCLASKACYMKKKMLEMGREIPKGLEGLAVKGQPQGKRLARRRPRENSEVDERRPARRGRGRPPNSTLESGDHAVASAVKTKAIEVSDDGDEEVNVSQGWRDLLSSTPKAKAQHGRPARGGGQRTPGNDSELLQLRIEAARAVEMEAAATQKKLEAAFWVQQYEEEHGY